MSSTSTTFINSINTNYPVPGVDNDTQGFRDNFSNIKSALGTVAGEIGNFQLNGVTTNGLNDFSYIGSLSRAVLDSYGESVGTNTFSTDDTINALEGNYQKVSVNTSLNIDVIDWTEASGVKGNVILEIYNSSGTSVNINFSNTLGTLKKDISLPVAVAGTSTVFVQLWTTDGGTNVFLTKIGGTFV